MNLKSLLVILKQNHKLIMHKNNLKSAILTLFAMGCALVVCLILASLIFPDLAQPFVRTYKSIVDGTLFDSRMPMIDLAVAIFVNHPIFGSGWGSYKYYYQSQIVYRERDYMNAHNIYLQMLAETGIVGTIFILALFVFMFIIATKNIRQNKEKDSYIGAFLLMHCYTMLEGMVGNSIYDFQQLLPYLILAVMVLSIYIDNKRRKIYMEQSKSKSHQKILSVSVASYNLGNMIEQNIKSFVESSVADDIELIITDDGSKDGTPEIVEKYVKQYPNTVKLIKKQNEGPGSTVNSGIKNATGKYFRMVDGDDWVNTENLADYVNLLKTVDVDMVISNFDVYDNSTDKIIKTEKFKLPENTVLNFNDFHLSVPNQMHAICYKTSIFKDNNITLDNCFYTDVEFVLFPVQFVKTLIYFNKTIYVYRVAQATQSVNPNSMRKNIAQHERVLEHLLETYSSNVTKYDEGNRDYIASRIALMANTNLNTLLLFEPSKENKARTKNFFVYLKNKNKEIYNIFKKSKKALLLNLSNFLSYNLVSKIIRKRSK